MRSLSSAMPVLLSLCLLPAQALAATPEDCRDGDPQSAIAACSALLTDAPDGAADWYAYRARARLQAGDAAAAREDLAKATAIDPVSGAAHAIRALVNLTEGDLAAAQSDAGMATILAPDLALVHVVQGQVMAALGAMDAARASFDTAAGLAADETARAQVAAARAEALAEAQPAEEAPPPAETVAPTAPAVLPSPPPTVAEDQEVPSDSGNSQTREDASAPVGEAASQAAEVTFWESVKDSQDPDELQAYLRAYPEGSFADLARIRLRRLEQAAAPPPAEPAPAPLADPEASPLVAACDAAAGDAEDSAAPADVAGIPWDQINEVAAITACGAALDAFPDHDRTAYNLGRAYHKAGIGAQAQQFYTLAAKDGYVRANVGLGFVHLDGLVGMPDPSRAVGFFRVAAKAGDRIAQNEMGVSFLDGRGVPPNDKTALRWFRAAAEQGLAEAQTSLGWMYEMGRGVARSNREAVTWYRRAAEQGYAVAQANLGYMYDHGRGVAADDRAAYDWFRRSADQGLPRGQVEVGRFFLDGIVVRKDAVEAKTWFDLAAQQDFPLAFTFLGWLHESERAFYDPDRAADYYMTALSMGETFPVTREAGSWDRRTAREVQRLLKERGVYSGAIDGLVGKGTLAAMKTLCGC